MATLLVIALFGAGAGLLLRWHLRRAEDVSLGAAEEAYAKLVRETIAAETADMRQEARRKPDRIRQLARSLSARGAFRSREVGDVLGWLERQLVLAGRPKGWSAQEAVVFALIVWFLGFCVALLAVMAGMPRLLVAVVLLSVLAYPNLKLRAMVKKRQDRARLEMPAFINDLVMAIGSASGSLDEAFSRAVADPNATGANRVLVREFAQAFAEYRHGNRDREEALRDAASRIGVESVDNFVEALIQGLRTGTPVKQVLMSQSAQIQAIFEQDMKAFIAKKQSSFVISLVMIFFGVILLVGTPLFLRLTGVFGG